MQFFKRILSFSVLFILIEANLKAETIVATSYAGGDGSKYNPYQISTLAELRLLSERPEDWYRKYFILTADIDASDTATWNIGDHDGNPDTPDEPMGFSPIGDYTDYRSVRQGVNSLISLNGQDYTIKGLTINRPNESNVGLIGYSDNLSLIQAGYNSLYSVKYLNLTQCNIIGGSNVGGIIGYCTEKIENCSVSGSVSGVNNIGAISGHLEGHALDYFFNITTKIANCSAQATVSGNVRIGGIAGCCYKYSEIKECISSCVISGQQAVGGIAGTIYGDHYSHVKASCSHSQLSARLFVGGIAGENIGGWILNCYSAGTVVAEEYSGGLVGITSGRVSNSYSKTRINCKKNAGALFGNASGVTRNCFWDIDLTGLDNMNGIGEEGLNTGLSQSVFLRRDFSTVWSFGSDEDNPWQDAGENSYPHLYWHPATFKPEIDDVADQSVNEHSTITFKIPARDIDTEQLSYTLIEYTPAGASIDKTGNFNWTPSELQDGEHLFKVQASDGNSFAETTFKIVVNEVNASPQIRQLYGKSTSENSNLSFYLEAVDNDFSRKSGTPFNLSYSNNTLSWEGKSELNVKEYQIKDSAGNLIQTVSDTGPSKYTAKTQSEVGVIHFVVVFASSKVETYVLSEGNIYCSDTLSYSIVNGLAGAQIDRETGNFSWTPNEAQDGSHTFKFEVNDGFQANQQTVNIYVKETNQKPILSPIGDKVISEEHKLSFSATAKDYDLPKNELSFFMTNAPLGSSFDPRSGTFVWTPSESQQGSYNVEVGVYDGKDTVYEKITISVMEVNKAPAIKPIHPLSVNELEDFSFSIVGSDDDLPKQLLTFSLKNEPDGLNINSKTGELSWSPTEKEDGFYTFKVLLSDTETISEQEVTLNVKEVNIQPSASNINQDIYFAKSSTRLYKPREIKVTDNDYLLKQEELITITLSLNPSLGELITRPGNIESYNPDTGIWRATGYISQINEALSALLYFSYSDQAHSIKINSTVMDGRENGSLPITGEVNIYIEDKLIGDSALSEASQEAYSQLNEELTNLDIKDVDQLNLKSYQLEINRNFDLELSKEELQKIIHAVNVGDNIIFYNFFEGWNIAYIPTQAQVSIKDFLLGNIRNYCWLWDDQQECYQPTECSDYKKACWVYCSEKHERVSACGDFFDGISSISNFKVGWNLCGIANKPHLQDSRVQCIWKWDAENKQYLKVDPEVVQPNEGYWIFYF